MTSAISILPKFNAKQAVEMINAYAADLDQKSDAALHAALRIGWALIEIKESLPHGDWLEWVRTNTNLKERTARKCKELAEKTALHAGIETKGLSVPMSQLLSLPEVELDAPALKAKQDLFDFMEEKTMKECLTGVVDGDEPHRITRAANGRKLGGSNGEDRKDFPKFIGEKLSDVAAHLKFWKSFTPAQVETTHTKFDGWLAKLPTPLLTHLKQRISEEIKTR